MSNDQPDHKPTHYKSILIPEPAGDYVPWSIEPTPKYSGPIGGMPCFHKRDTINFNIYEVKPGSGTSSLEFMKLPGHESKLDTPFKEYNHSKEKSSYPYTLGQVLTFDHEGTKDVQWSFTLYHDDGNGSNRVIKIDPELQVGTGIDLGGHK